MAFDFSALAAALLARSPVVVQEWLPGGKFDGDEYHAAKKAAGGPGDSLTVNVRTGCWQHFATGDSGGDLISLYAYREHLTQLAAAKELAEELHFELEPEPRRTNGANGHAPALQAPAVSRAPADAPPIPDHHKHGAAARSWAYRDARGVLYHTARYDTPDGKQFCYFTWDGSKWRAKAPEKPRALYGLDRLAAAPASTPVLIVEGEKCADAAAIALPAYVAMTWAGGAGAVDTADWTVLRGRKVYLWPDADRPGRDAVAKLSARLLALACAVSAVNPDEAPEGWDIADAVTDGWTAERIAEWVRPRLKPVVVAAVFDAPRGTKVGRPHSGEPPITIEKVSFLTMYQQFGLSQNSGGLADSNAANVALIVLQHPQVKGRVWFDTFRGGIWHRWRCDKPRQWTDDDETDFLVWAQQEMGLRKLGILAVRHGVYSAASANRRNSVTDWLESIEWDRIERLDDWTEDFLGCPRDEHHRITGRNWILSMVARAFDPGCQVDTVPVLEGLEGKRKSAAVRVLGGEWFASLDQSFGTVDFLQCIQGQWLIEIPDLAGFRGRDHTIILSAISRQVDRYRKSYGHFPEDRPRKCVFAVTTELSADYLQDSRGKRRFWPLRCKGEIDDQALAAARPQLFAEAVARYRAGDKWWHVSPETRAMQEGRVSQHPWTDCVLDYANSQVDGVSSEEILRDGLYFELKDRTDGAKRIVFNILTADGWEQTSTTRRGKKLRLWKKIAI